LICFLDEFLETKKLDSLHAAEYFIQL